MKIPEGYQGIDLDFDAAEMRAAALVERTHDQKLQDFGGVLPGNRKQRRAHAALKRRLERRRAKVAKFNKT